MYPYIKRFFDLLFSVILLLVISPILIPVMIGLKLTGEGHIWYLQERVGKNNKLFDIYKYMIMKKILGVCFEMPKRGNRGIQIICSLTLKP